MSVARASAILREGRGQQWDAEIVDAFLRSIADQWAEPAVPQLHLVSRETPETA
jgi:HD-GYP domain-containing protein (c-di-GMP phosphodiesterase class II)